jgi:hypothetical protein
MLGPMGKEKEQGEVQANVEDEYAKKTRQYTLLLIYVPLLQQISLLERRKSS